MSTSIIADIHWGLNGGSIFATLFYGLVIICLVRMSKYLLNAGKEQKLIRLEVGKLAGEVHEMCEELQYINEKERGKK